MDLTKVSMGEALQIALTQSGRSIDAVAEEMGWSPGQGYRFFNVNDAYWPPAHSIPRLCSVLGNTIILDWLNRNTAELCSLKGKPLSVSGCLRQISTLLERMGETSGVVGRIVEDDKITPAEARELTRKLTRMAADLFDFISSSERTGKIG
ncbi:MAG: hypothetical protein EOM25_05775 [Deltaproteobacteria bacterium]|nr:hypothetical protein [Deltaproteobacteria bacterium]